MNSVGGSINYSLKIVKKYWKFQSIIFLICLFFVVNFNQRNLNYMGRVDFTSDFSTAYGTYSSGLTKGEEFSQDLMGDEFLQKFISENKIDIDLAKLRTYVSLSYLDANQFKLDLKTEQLDIIRLFKAYMVEQASDYMSYAIQRRAIDTFVNNFHNAYKKNLNELNYNLGLIELYKKQLQELQPYLIQTNALVVVNPSYSYVEQKILDLEFNNMQLQPSIDYYLKVTQDLQAQQALYTTFDGYLSSDRRLDSNIDINFTLDEASVVDEMRWSNSTMVYLSLLISIFIGSLCVFMNEKYQISRDQLQLTMDALIHVAQELKHLWKNHRVLWNQIKSLFKQMSLVIQTKNLNEGGV